MLAALYNSINDAVRHLLEGDPSGVETAVRFLEADVFCHRSGYVTADVIRGLLRVDLDSSAVDRLQSVVLRAVDGPDRREFRRFVRLARHVDSPGLRAALASRVESEEPRVARHARWILDGLAR